MIHFILVSKFNSLMSILSYVALQILFVFDFQKFDYDVSIKDLHDLYV